MTKALSEYDFPRTVMAEGSSRGFPMWNEEKIVKSASELAKFALAAILSVHTTLAEWKEEMDSINGETENWQEFINGVIYEGGGGGYMQDTNMVIGIDEDTCIILDPESDEDDSMDDDDD